MADSKNNSDSTQQNFVCKNCNEENLPKSKFCSHCGQSLVKAEQKNDKDRSAIIEYTEFLNNLNTNQTNFFKQCIYFGGIITLIFLIILGIYSWEGVQINIKALLDERVKNCVKQELTDDKVKKLVNEEFKKATGIEIIALNKGIKEAKKEVDGIKDRYDPQFKHTIYYNFIRIARGMAKDTINKNIAVVNYFFNESKDKLEKHIRNYPLFAPSYFELGRLHHYYMDKYKEYLGDPTDDDLIKARSHYEDAISNYTPDEKEKYIAEPTFYIAHISMRLNLMNENKYPLKNVKEGVKTLLDILNKMEKHEFIVEVEKIQGILKKKRKKWTSEDTKTIDEFASFKDGQYYLDF